MALQSMLNEAQGYNEDDGHVFGSALNPSSLHRAGEKKEIAKPLVKMDIKTNNRGTQGGAVLSEEEIKQNAPKEADPHDIWTEQEINVKAEERPDDRPQPEFDVLYNQTVGTEDVFLGLSDKDPSSTHC